MKNKVFSLFVFIGFLFTAPVYADSVRVKVSDLSHMATKLFAARDTGTISRHGAKFSSYVNGVGRVSFDFYSVKKSPVIPVFISESKVIRDTNPVVLMKGFAETGGTIERAAGMLSFEAGVPTLTVDFPHVSSNTGERTLYRIIASNIQSSASTQLERTKDVHFRGKSCGNDTPLLHAVSHSSEETSNETSPDIGFASLKEIELSLHLDSAYISSFGNSSSYIQGIMNAAETIYEDDLGLTFTIKRILADSGLFFFDGEGDTVLVEFASYIDDTKGITSTADVFHVFTGIDLKGGGNSSVIGVAFIGVQNDSDPGVVCRPDRFNGQPFNFGIRPAAVGATERSGSSTAGSLMVTFAHEMGHNFSSEHSSSGIMTASLDFNNLPGSFSSASKNVIGSYVSKHGSCLAVQEDDDSDDDDSDDDDDDSDSGGGGSGGGSDGRTPDSVAVDFENTLTEEGLLTATISIDDDPGDSCKYRLYLATRKNAGRGTVVASTDATDRSHTFFAEIDRKAKKRNKKGKRIKIWATAVYECPTSISGQSDAQILKAHQIKVKKKVGPKRWIKLLRKQLLSDQ